MVTCSMNETNGCDNDLPAAQAPLHAVSPDGQPGQSPGGQASVQVGAASVKGGLSGNPSGKGIKSLTCWPLGRAHLFS